MSVLKSCNLSAIRLLPLLVALAVLVSCESPFGSEEAVPAPPEQTEDPTDDGGSGGTEDPTSDTETFRVFYRGNGHSGGDAPADLNKYQEGDLVTVSDKPDGLYRYQHEFVAWNLSDDGFGESFLPGSQFEMGSEDVVLYADWAEWDDSLAVSRTFRARTSTDGTWYDVPATLESVGRHALVYAETGRGISIETSQSIVEEYDAKIDSLIRTNFGDFPDVDGNGRIIILLLDIVDGFAGSGGYVAGYFDPTHLFSQSTFSESNEADMVFMDVDPGVPGSAQFFTTIAHEMQHIVNFGATYLEDQTEQQLWINEGLSTGAEYLYHEGASSSRVDYYNNDPLDTIKYGNNFLVWNGVWEDEIGDRLANYATAYVFFQWLRIHATNGTEIYGDILRSPYRDSRAVSNAVQTRIDPTLENWEDVLSSWYHANAIGSVSGLTGYEQEINITPWSFFNTGGEFTADLYPSEGVLIATSDGSFTADGSQGSSIRYHGVSTSTGVIDTTGPTYFGDFVLVFNSSSSPDGLSQPAPLPAVSDLPDFSYASSGIEPASLPDVFPIDVHFDRDNGFAPVQMDNESAQEYQNSSRTDWSNLR
jgi:hypothetical protein